MEENTRHTININIHGGNNQILPTATKAEQYFYFSGSDAVPTEEPRQPHGWTAEDETRLSLYVSDKSNLPVYIATLTACRTAREVGEAVAQMCADEPKLDGDLIAKEKFIRLLLPFLTGVRKGKGIDNLREYINQAWLANKRKRPKI